MIEFALGVFISSFIWGWLQSKTFAKVEHMTEAYLSENRYANKLRCQLSNAGITPLPYPEPEDEIVT